MNIPYVQCNEESILMSITEEDQGSHMKCYVSMTAVACKHELRCCSPARLLVMAGPLFVFLRCAFRSCMQASIAANCPGFCATELVLCCAGTAKCCLRCRVLVSGFYWQSVIFSDRACWAHGCGC